MGGQEPEAVNYGAAEPYPMPAPEPPAPAYQGYTPPPPPPMPYPGPAPYPGPMPGYGVPQPVVAMPVAYLPVRRTNGLAIASLVCSLLGLLCLIPALLGVIFGHMSLSQIRQNGEDGRGLAVAGLVIGYVLLAITALFLVFYVGLVGMVLSSSPR